MPKKRASPQRLKTPAAEIKFEPDSCLLEDQHLTLLKAYAERLRHARGGWLAGYQSAATAGDESHAFHMARQRLQAVADALYRLGVKKDSFLLMNFGCRGAEQPGVQLFIGD